MNCSLPQLKHCFIFWSALARFDFGQGFSLVHGARSCVCNRGITCSDRLVEKAICTDTDQMGAFPLKSAARLAFCIPLVTWLLTVTFSSVQVCLTLSDADGWTWPPLVAWFLGGEAGWGSFLSRRSRTGDTEPWTLAVQGCSSLGHDSDPLSETECVTTESWSSGIIHSLYSSFFFWLSSVLRAPRRQERKFRAWFLVFLC